MKTLEGFKTFVLRGNVVDLATGVIIGAAFTGIVNSLVKDLITPFLGIFGGIPDFSEWSFAINSSQFAIGNFINAMLSFLLTAAVLYWGVITPVNRLMDLRKVEEPPAPATRECPECASKVPLKARRCPFCTSHLEPVQPVAEQAPEKALAEEEIGGLSGVLADAGTVARRFASSLSGSN